MMCEFDSSKAKHIQETLSARIKPLVHYQLQLFLLITDVSPHKDTKMLFLLITDVSPHKDAKMLVLLITDVSPHKDAKMLDLLITDVSPHKDAKMLDLLITGENTSQGHKDAGPYNNR